MGIIHAEITLSGSNEVLLGAIPMESMDVLIDTKK
jgi:hypothetical protein